MKAKKFIVAFVAIFALLFTVPIETTATPPPWAPAHGYRQKTKHIYFPQQNFYYDLHRGVYIYANGKKWVTSVTVPAAYRGVNLRLAPQVQLNVVSNKPYIYNRDHKAKYWNSKAQKEHFKRMEKNRKAYYKEVNKAQKQYHKNNKKAVKKYYKNNGKVKKNR